MSKGPISVLNLAFGVVNGPPVFQEIMSIVLQGCGSFAIAYLDDIIIFSLTLEKHFEHLQTVFGHLRNHKLKLQLKKCSFLHEETPYLGYLVGAKGIRDSPDKCKSIRAMPPPTCVKEVRSYLGFCSYYRCIIPSFSRITEPLIKLTKKYARFKWTPECQEAFDCLKDGLTAIPMLGHANVNSGYILYTDALNDTVVAVLVQLCKETDSIIPEEPNE